MLKPKTKTKRIDHYKKKLEQRLKEIDGAFVKVGFPSEGTPGVPNAGESHSSTISEVALVAVYNEFGTENIPARPFLSPSYRQNLDSFRKMLLKQNKLVINGKTTVQIALSKVGELHVSVTKKYVRDLKTPPNSEATKRQKKGADNPLINTGQMINSIQYEVKA